MYAEGDIHQTLIVFLLLIPHLPAAIVFQALCAKPLHQRRRHEAAVSALRVRVRMLPLRPADSHPHFRGRIAAQHRAVMDQRSLRPGACRRNRGANSRHATAEDANIECVGLL